MLLALFAASTMAFAATQFEAKFDSMLAACSLSPRAIEFVDSEKQRLLFKGVLAAKEEPLITEAFAIVYSELGPVRVAGDLIFKSIAQEAAAATERAGEVQGEDSTTELAMEDGASELATARKLFDLLDGDASGSLDRAELLNKPQLLALIRAEEDEDDAAAVERFMGDADTDGDGSISFVEWANAAAAEPRLRSADEALEAALEALEASEAADKSSTAPRGLFGRKTPEARFDAMLDECLAWEGQLNCGPLVDECEAADGDEEGRLLRVLRGSLAGARCAPVAEALRVCYLEYSPLRLGGDLIFKLLKRIVAAQLKSRASPG
jgi:hypothetical protein